MKKIDKALKELGQLYDFYKEISRFQIINKDNVTTPVHLSAGNLSAGSAQAGAQAGSSRLENDEHELV